MKKSIFVSYCAAEFARIFKDQHEAVVNDEAKLASLDGIFLSVDDSRSSHVRYTPSSREKRVFTIIQELESKLTDNNDFKNILLIFIAVATERSNQAITEITENLSKLVEIVFY